MNKRFASFLFTGKIAALPLFAQESLGALHDIYMKDSILLKMNKTLASETLSVKKSDAFEEHNKVSLQKQLDFHQVANIMNLVITGLYDKDEVLIIISPEKDVDNFLEVNPTLLSKLNEFEIWNRFSVISTSPIYKTIPIDINRKKTFYSRKAVKPISIPVDLSSVSTFIKEGNTLYLHILVAPNSKWDKSVIRYTDVLELKSIGKSMLLSQYTEDCSLYTCTY